MKTSKAEWKRRAAFLRKVRDELDADPYRGLCRCIRHIQDDCFFGKRSVAEVRADEASADYVTRLIDARLDAQFKRGQSGFLLEPAPHRDGGYEMRRDLLDRWIANCKRRSR